MSERRVASLALLVWAFLTASVTLLPAGGMPSPPFQLCLICGDRGLADAILNVALFLPAGVALRWMGVGAKGALILVVAASGSIEILQIFLPGRHPSLGDLFFNVMGGSLGAAIPASRLRGAPPLLPVVAAATVLMAATGWLASATPPPGALFAQWAPPPSPSAKPWGGRILAARVGPLALPDGPLEAPVDVWKMLMGGAPLHLSLVAGPATVAPTPIFALADPEGRSALTLGAAGDRLFVQRRSLASLLRLDEPAALLVGAVSDVVEGDSLGIEIRLDGAGVDGVLTRGDGLVWRGGALTRISRAWSFLYFDAALPPRVARLADVLYLFALGALVGLCARGSRGLLLGDATLVAAALILPLASPVSPPQAIGVAGLLAGSAFAFGARGIREGRAVG